MKRLSLVVIACVLSGCASPELKKSFAADDDFKSASCTIELVEKDCNVSLAKPTTQEFTVKHTPKSCHKQVVADLRKQLNSDLEFVKMGIPNYNYAEDRKKTFGKDSYKLSIEKCGSYNVTKTRNPEWVKYNKAKAESNSCLTETTTCKDLNEKVVNAESEVKTIDKVIYYTSMVLALPFIIVAELKS